MQSIALVFDSQALDGDKAARDVLDQLDAIEPALRELGFAAARLPVGLDLARFKRDLAAARPDLVFNLVESLDGSDRLQSMAPMLLEEWRLAFTGSGSEAMLLANHKIAAKRALAGRGLPVPGCAWLDAGGAIAFMPGGGHGGDWIVKTLDSHASLFLDDSSVLRGADPAALARRLAEAEAGRGQRFFAERFVDGREFNLSILEDDAGRPAVLPASEISFANLAPDKPRIVGHAAKWEEDSAEYRHTPRVDPDEAKDGALLKELSRLALSAWEALGLAGYARVDFRVDTEGRPFILEANANPCLTPGAGMAVTAERAGLNYAEMIGRIVRAGLRRRRDVAGTAGG